jgi:hypothetical protein
VENLWAEEPVIFSGIAPSGSSSEINRSSLKSGNPQRRFRGEDQHERQRRSGKEKEGSRKEEKA